MQLLSYRSRHTRPFARFPSTPAIHLWSNSEWSPGFHVEGPLPEKVRRLPVPEECVLEGLSGFRMSFMFPNPLMWERELKALAL